MEKCPCGSSTELGTCCGAIIGGAPAPTAESLMRARYTAFVLGNIDFVEKSQATEALANFNRSAAENKAKSVEWVNLEIRATSGGGDDDDTGMVEFAARFREDDVLMLHHEQATFRREEGQWLYVDGKMNPKGQPRQVQKTGRNEPCPCGSGKKYKKCCGA